jgi:hypothetical protein
MSTFIDFLAAQSRAPEIAPDAPLDAALARLDRMLAELAAELEVEYYGPEVGIAAGRQVYRLVVRRHTWRILAPGWSLKICTALPHAGWRADWPVQGAGRLRQRAVVRALPAFFAGYREAVRAAGRADSPAGRRVAELAARFGADDR